jgi:protoporphyrinogen oxidase
VLEVVAGGETLKPSHVISSLPLRTTVGISDPDAPGEVRDAARGLRYRDFLTVSLVIGGTDNLFPDNWIYIHQPGVRVLRIQNFRSWSPWMVPNKTDASVGMEYFCFEGDDLWSSSDDELVELAKFEIEKLGLARADAVKFGFVVRVHKAYPIYDVEYAERVGTIRTWLDQISNLTQVGRNGLHRYNNSDHSMLTAMRAVDNLLLGTHHDIWAVNVENVYHEEQTENEEPYRDPPSTPAMEQPLASER